jgi:hypothetical protein
MEKRNDIMENAAYKLAKELNITVLEAASEVTYELIFTIN